MLYLVSTPIGNLSDITLRAIEVLKNCDYILCEDTRHSLHLLQEHGIRKPLKSYHKFNESSQLDQIISDLESGQQIALITDAGTPGIADPGAAIVNACIQKEIPVTAIPGACALIHALICSGLPTQTFQFVGFLEKKEKALKDHLTTILMYEGTTICYESPHRLLDTIKIIHELDPFRSLVVARELTKKFEEFRRGTPAELLHSWENHPVKGEVVLMIAPSTNKKVDWTSLSPEEHLDYLQKHYGLTKKEAIKMVAEQRGVPKREIYKTTYSSTEVSTTDS